MHQPWSGRLRSPWCWLGRTGSPRPTPLSITGWTLSTKCSTCLRLCQVQPSASSVSCSSGYLLFCSSWMCLALFLCWRWGRCQRSLRPLLKTWTTWGIVRCSFAWWALVCSRDWLASVGVGNRGFRSWKMGFRLVRWCQGAGLFWSAGGICTPFWFWQFILRTLVTRWMLLLWDFWSKLVLGYLLDCH